jgi:hypothetical protein
MDVSTIETNTTDTHLAPVPPGKASPWWWVVATLIALLMMFVFIVAGLQIVDLRSDLARANNTLQQVTTLQQQQSQQWYQAHPQINSQLQQLTTAQTQQQQQVQQLQQQLEAWQLRWEQALSKDPLKRQINELQDVLDQAHRHLLLTASVPQTQALLEQAHALCVRFESSLLQPVCLLIAQDELALENYHGTDLNRILQQLSQLESQVLLPLQQAQRLQFSPQSPVASTASEAEDTDLLNALLNKMLSVLSQLGRFISEHLVQVHHLHPSGQDRYQLQLPELDHMAARLSLLFQQARTALLIQNQSVFQSVLHEIEVFVDAQNTLLPDHAVITDELQQLQQLTIDQAPPLTLKANEMLTRLLQSFAQSGTTQPTAVAP